VSFFEWLGRVIMLVLAGMITLSIISALAAISSTTVPQQLGIERAAQPVPPGGEEASLAPTPAPPPAGSKAEPAFPTREVTIAPAPNKPADPERWLEHRAA
jgi:hypothetical protein